MTRAVEIDLPFIHRYRDRHGHERFYFRRKGLPKVTLPHPDSEHFLEAYRKASTPNEPPAAKRVLLTKGSLALLCHEYRNSADFLQLAVSTRREMGYVIDKLVTEHGDKRVATLERRHILSMKDRLAAKPGAANKMLRTLKRLLTFAADRGWRNDNPSSGITMMKLGRYRAWSDAELEQYESRWPLGTLERTGYALALYTAQRRGDLVKLKWSSIAGGTFRLTQSKTGEPIAIPIEHPDLKAALKAVHPRRESAILTGAQGKALNAVYFGHIMAKAVAEAGLPAACVLHGLRKTAAKFVRESGGDVGSVTGHRSPRMVAEYSRDADQEKLSRSSMLKWAASSQKGKRRDA